MRTLKNSNEFFDLLDQMGDNKFVTVGYVTGANLDVPKIKKLNPATNRMKGYDDYSSFQGEGEDEIGALVKISSYNFRYRNRNSVAKQYDQYKQDANKIRAEYGLDPIGDKQGYASTNTYGKNGVSVYNRDKEELQGHTYYPQNLHGMRAKGVVYAVNTEGHIIKELSDEQVKPYLKAKQEVSGVAALRKMGAEEEQIKSYVEKINGLGMSYKQLEANSILWIAATVNGEKVVYINDHLTRAVNDININPQDFIAIAKERYAQDLNQIQESINRMNKMNNRKKMLSESRIDNIIKESTRRVINEMSPEVYAAYAQGRAAQGNSQRNESVQRKTIRLTEADVQNMIKESVMNILRSRGQRLNEVMGWDLEKEDVEWVNDENDGTKPWLVGLWPGSGYLLTHYGVWAFRDEMEAVEKVVAYLDQEGQDAFFISPEDIERQRQENIQDGFSEDDAEAMIDEKYLYVDGTEFGASEPHYIYLENLKVIPYDESKFRS